MTTTLIIIVIVAIGAMATRKRSPR